MQAGGAGTSASRQAQGQIALFNCLDLHRSRRIPAHPGSKKTIWRFSEGWWDLGRPRRGGQFKYNCFAQTRSSSEEGSYFRLIDVGITQL